MGYLTPQAQSGSSILQDLTTNEKISLLSGVDFWHTASISRLSIPSLRMSDGPNGVRGTKFFDSVPAACLPCGTALASTWNTAMMNKAGRLIAEECRSKSAHVWLGPTANIPRSPLGGRGFESFSEDPLLSGRIASAIISAVQESGVASSLKHFVANDMEHERTRVNCIISQRALREIYLLPFQIAIRDADPWVLMTAYNKVNGTHASEHSGLLLDIVRKEWKYTGCIISDWFGTYSTTEAINAGLDIEMPGPSGWRASLLSRAIGAGKVSSAVLDERVSSVLRLVERCSRSNIPEAGPETCLDSLEQREALRDLAADGIVLLQNTNSVLPLDPSKTVAVIGPNARKALYCGGGSASLRPYRSVTIHDALSEQLGTTLPVADGCVVFNSLPVLGNLVRSPVTGRQGQFSMNIFRFPLSSDSAQEPLDTFELDDTNVILYDYAHPSAPDNVLYATIEADLVVERSGVYSFGLTVAGTASLFLDDTLVVANVENQTRGESFFGSGSIEEVGEAELSEGKAYRLRVDFGSAPTSGMSQAGAPVFGAGGVRIGCARCADQSADIDEAVQLAKSVDQVVLCVGLGPDWESEGADRAGLALPGLQEMLIPRICAVNQNVAVVLQSGTPVSGPWDQVPAIMQAWYGGNEGGHAIADVLLGKRNPSGKLPLSWPRHIEQTPAYLSYRSEAGRCYYSEDVFVGYRYYEKTKQRVQWPFGHGLSYASFRLHDLRLEREGSGLNGRLIIAVAVENTSSSMDGSEVCQAYIRRVGPSVVSRPVKELKGFDKVFVPAGETRAAIITISTKYGTSIWDETADTWLMEKGTYELLVGNSSACVPLSTFFDIESSLYWRGV